MYRYIVGSIPCIAMEGIKQGGGGGIEECYAKRGGFEDGNLKGLLDRGRARLRMGADEMLCVTLCSTSV